MARFGVAVCLAAVMGVCVGPGRAAAQEEEEETDDFVCERAKLNTEDAAPVGEGVVYLETAYTFRHARRWWNDDWAGERRPHFREHDVVVDLTYGISDTFEIAIDMGYADIHDSWEDDDDGRGMMDVSLSAKWIFYNDDEAMLSMAYMPGVTIPCGQRTNSRHLGPSQEYYSFDQKVALSKDWGRWTGNWDLGFSLPCGEDADGSRGYLDTNAALGYHVTDWLQPECELNYAHDFVRSEDDMDDLAVTAGFIFCVSDSVRVDLGAQRSVAGRNTDRGTSVMAVVATWW